MVKGKKGPGPLTSEDDQEPMPLPPQPNTPTFPLIPALGIEEPPIGVVIDEESPLFRAALAGRIAQLQVLRDESSIMVQKTTQLELCTKHLQAVELEVK